MARGPAFPRNVFDPIVPWKAFGTGIAAGRSAAQPTEITKSQRQARAIAPIPVVVMGGGILCRGVGQYSS